MNMEVFCVNRKGLSHTRLEDAIYRNDDDLVYGVFDGVSASKYGAEAANALAEEMGRCFHDPSFKKAVMTYPVQEVRQAIVEAIQQSSRRVQKKYSCEMEDAACTMVLCVLDSKTKMATILHCGDGTAFAVSDTSYFATATVLSYPDNAASGAVYPAQHISQLSRMRVTRVSLESLRGIIICTDGFSSAYLNPMRAIFDSYGLQRVFKSSSVSELDEIIDEVHIKDNGIGDDISAIMLKFDNHINYSNLKNEEKQMFTALNNNEESADGKKEIGENPSITEDIPVKEKSDEQSGEKKADDKADIISSDVTNDNASAGENYTSDFSDRKGSIEEQYEEPKRETSRAVTANHIVTAALTIVVIVSLAMAYMMFSGYQKEKTKNSESVSNLQSSVSQLAEENELINSRIDKLEGESGAKEETSEPDESTTEDNSEDYQYTNTENSTEEPTDFFNDEG